LERGFRKLAIKGRAYFINGKDKFNETFGWIYRKLPSREEMVRAWAANSGENP
jgi:hypothetical protein